MSSSDLSCIAASGADQASPSCAAFHSSSSSVSSGNLSLSTCSPAARTTSLALEWRARMAMETKRAADCSCRAGEAETAGRRRARRVKGSLKRVFCRGKAMHQIARCKDSVAECTSMLTPPFVSSAACFARVARVSLSSSSGMAWGEPRRAAVSRRLMRVFEGSGGAEEAEAMLSGEANEAKRGSTNLALYRSLHRSDLPQTALLTSQLTTFACPVRSPVSPRARSSCSPRPPRRPRAADSAFPTAGQLVDKVPLIRNPGFWVPKPVRILPCAVFIDLVS